MTGTIHDQVGPETTYDLAYRVDSCFRGWVVVQADSGFSAEASTECQSWLFRGADDDDSSVGDDDDSTPPVAPLAVIIGVFNLTNVVQSETSSYIDFSGAFGSFAEIETDTLSPTAYLGTFNYSADAPYCRRDLGGFPLPAEGEAVIINLFE